MTNPSTPKPELLGHTHLAIGGARSGKTAHALSLARSFKKRIYIATAEVRDDEMAERVRKHRAERKTMSGEDWITVEAPLNLETAIHLSTFGDNCSAVESTIIVVDCLTLWLTNILLAERDIEAETQTLLRAIRDCPHTLVLVSNEIGQGIVPSTPLGRAFRDHQGRLNQAMAAAADTVELVVAGLPLRLKPGP